MLWLPILPLYGTNFVPVGETNAPNATPVVVLAAIDDRSRLENSGAGCRPKFASLHQFEPSPIDKWQKSNGESNL